MRGIFLVGAAALTLGGCATVIEGTTQNVSVITQPPGASCTVSRDGVVLGAVSSTPGSVKVGKSKNDLAVTCSKEGYETATMNYPSSFNGMTFGNILVGGAIGAVVDASSGANYNYPKEVSMSLAEADSAAPATAAATQTPAPPPVVAASALASEATPAPAAASVPPDTRMSTPVAD